MRFRGHNLPFDPDRKLRTQEHVIADLSYNFLERKVLKRGHWLDSPRNDYGIDATMFHHNERGEIENGEVRFQLKAVSKLKLVSGRDWIPVRSEMKDLRYWYFEYFPVILVLYDADKDRAFWLHIQDYVEKNQRIMSSDAETVTLRMLVRNKLTTVSIDRFRKMSLARFKKIERNRR